MAPDQENREAKAKKRAETLALQRTQARTKFKHPQAGLRADISRMAQRSKAGQKIPFSNRKLRDIVLWRHTRKGSRRASGKGQLSVKMNMRDNGGELEMDDSKMDTLVGIKKEPYVEQAKILKGEKDFLKDSQDTLEDEVQSAFKDLEQELIKQKDKDAGKEKN